MVITGWLNNYRFSKGLNGKYNGGEIQDPADLTGVPVTVSGEPGPDPHPTILTAGAPAGLADLQHQDQHQQHLREARD